MFKQSYQKLEIDKKFHLEPTYIYLDKNHYNKIYSPPKNKSNNQYKNIYCANCGEKGHVVKECGRPITSFGIIAFKIIKNKQEEELDTNIYLSNLVKNVHNINVYPKIKYLLIQRKDTMGYIDFIRGKYPNTDDING